MRLIDAEEVKRFYEEEFPTLDNGVHWSKNDIIMNLSNIPTVKAIPTETIKKEIERLKEDIKWAWYYGNTALDKMEYLKMWLEIKLEDWEKENEVD